MLWGYTDLSDSRFRWGQRSLFVRQDVRETRYQKIGLSGGPPWLAYVVDDSLFVKTTQEVPQSTYPDRGSLLEIFTNSDMLELETLSPLVRVPPDGMLEHSEEWSITPIETGEINQIDAAEARVLTLIEEQIR